MAIDSLVAEEVVTGDFWVNGTISDDLLDRVKSVRLKVGSEPQVDLARSRVFAAEVDTSTWDSGEWYWVGVTVEDDRSFGKAAVKVCYDTSGTPCDAGAPVNGSGSGGTNGTLG